MKSRFAAMAAFAIAAALFPQPSSAQQPVGWYLGLGGGYGPMQYTFA